MNKQNKLKQKKLQIAIYKTMDFNYLNNQWIIIICAMW
jgi:hypothetical protein